MDAMAMELFLIYMYGTEHIGSTMTLFPGNHKSRI